MHANPNPSLTDWALAAVWACTVIVLKLTAHTAAALLVVAVGLVHAATYYLASRTSWLELWLTRRTGMPAAGAHIGAGLAAAVSSQFPRPTTTRSWPRS